MLQHKGGRTQLDFQYKEDGISHSVMLGELQGEEVKGMTASAGDQKAFLAESTMRELGSVTDKLNGVRDKVSTIRIDPSQAKGGKAVNLNTATLSDVLESLQTFQQSLAHPNLAPANLEWKNEQKLKQLVAAAHP